MHHGFSSRLDAYLDPNIEKWKSYLMLCVSNQTILTYSIEYLDFV